MPLETGKLLTQLQSDILNSAANLSDILRRAKVLASALGNTEFEQWVDAELNGYHDDVEPPSYRRSMAHNLGDFSGPFQSGLRNAPIPISALPKELERLYKEMVLYDGVGGLTSMAESSQESFRMGWSADAIAYTQGLSHPGLDCVQAWMTQPRSTVVQVLDSVRNRLLNFVLELEKNHSEILDSEKSITQNQRDQVGQVFNTYIVGDHNIVPTGVDFDQTVSQEITQHDVESLIKYLEDMGIPTGDTYELREAIEQDGPTKEPHAYGPKLISWFRAISCESCEWNLASFNTHDYQCYCKILWLGVGQ